MAVKRPDPLCANQRGFSILEVVMATVALLVIVLGMSFGLKSLLKGQLDFAKNSEVSADTAILFRTLENSLYNVTRIFPNEDLLTTGDRVYQGLNALNTDVAGCSSINSNGGAPYAAMRWTAIERRSPAEEVLRPFSEDAPMSSLANGARISYAAETSRIFYDGKNPKELIALDADGWATRRFKVQSFATVSTATDPYDDVTILPSAIKYTQLILSPGQNAQGASLSPGDHKFIATSYVYSSETNVLCVDSDQNIVMKNQTMGTQRILFNTQASGFKLKSFEIHYLKSLVGVTVDDTLAYPFPVTTDDAKCLKSIIVILRMVTLDGLGGESLVRSFSVPNFSARAPAACPP